MKINDPNGILKIPQVPLFPKENERKVTVTEQTINFGRDGDKEIANKYLEVGKKYTIERTEVGGWHTDVYLKEFPGISFNIVNFTPA